MERQGPWLEQFLLELMAARSTAGWEEEAQRLVGRELKTLPLDVARIPGPSTSDPQSDSPVGTNLSASWRHPEASARSLVLSGHVDVLEPPLPEAWPFPPFMPRVTDGVVEGWGGLKAGLVCMLGVLRTLHAMNAKPGGPVRLHSVIGEELGGSGTEAVLRTFAPTGSGALVAGAVGEALPLAQVGVAWLSIDATALPGHAGDARGGRSAIDWALIYAEEARRFAAEREVAPPPAFRGIPGSLAFNVGTIRGGSYPSLTASECVVQCRLAVFSDESIESVVDDLRQRIVALHLAMGGLAECLPALEVQGFRAEGYELSSDSAFVQAALDALARGGMAKHVSVSTSSTDTRCYIERGVPAFLIGPPVHNLHGIVEAVNTEDMVRCAKEVAIVLYDWCGVQFN